MNDNPLTAVQRLRAAFDAAPPDTRRLRSLAATYTPNERMEQLLALRETEPAVFTTLATPQLRMSLGSYEQAKAAHEEYNKP